MYVLGFILGFLHGVIFFYATRVIAKIKNQNETQ